MQENIRTTAPQRETGGPETRLHLSDRESSRPFAHALLAAVAGSVRRFFRFAILPILIVGLSETAHPQTVTATLSTGNSPTSVAVNPVTNKTYVVNLGSSTVTIIDGATNSATTVAVGDAPQSVGVNPVTNKIYVANAGGESITVIDGATNATTTVLAGSTPWAVAVNPATNKIYVANYSSNNVTVIDGADNSTTTVTAGKEPFSVVVNPATNKIYVANYGSNNVTVIDGASNSATIIAAGSNPRSVAVNPATNKIYVANAGDNTVLVIDGATNTTKTVLAGSSSSSVAVNPVTNKVYVAGGAGVTVIDGVTNSTTMVTVGADPYSVIVNAATNEIYVTNQFSNTVTLIDGSANTTVTLATGTGPSAAALNPVTNKIYIGNVYSNNLTVIDGATSDTTALAAGSQPWAVAVNPVTNKVYVANPASNNVTVIDGATNNTTFVAAGSLPSSVAVNPITNKIYVGNWDSDSTVVIDGATNSTTTVAAAGGPFSSSIAVNPLTNKIYVAGDGQSVTVIDGATNETTTIPTPLGPWSVAVNPVTNKIYVANFYSNNVTVIDGDSNSTITVAVGSYPQSVGVNSITNKIYVANSGGNTVTVIDGVTNNTTTVQVGSQPRALAVNPVTNKIYVANTATFIFAAVASKSSKTSLPNGLFSPINETSTNSSVTVIDGATNATTTLPVGSSPFSVAVNPVTNKIYVANEGGNTVTVIDGATNTTTSVTAGSAPFSVAVNPVTNQIYIANEGSNSVTVVDEQQLQPISLTTSISPLPNNLADTPTPSFTFDALSAMGTTPDGVYFQVDTWQNDWSTALGKNPSFSGTVLPLQPGFHILYAYAGDGQEATSTQAGSPLTGAVQAYGFVVPRPTPGPPTVVSLTPMSGSGTTQTFTGVYSDPNGAGDISNVEILLNTTARGANACYVMYLKGYLYLQNDTWTGWSAGLSPGSTAHVSNSQCTLSASGSSYSVSGNTATLNVALTFSSSFSGPKNVYLRATEADGSNSGWVQMGAWGAMSIGSPTVVSVTPSLGSGAMQTFTGVYSDPNGGADLTNVQILFNTTSRGAYACYVMYLDGSLYLQNDGWTGWSAGVSPGSTAQVSNSQCTLSAAGSSYSVSGNMATLTVALTFSGSFGGPKNVYLRAWETDGANSGWVQAGKWGAMSIGSPTVVSVTPSSGSGATQTFTGVYSDPNGGADLTNVQILFNTTPLGAYACYIMYLDGSLYLQNDGGTGWSAGMTPGSTAQVSNSQCTLSAAGSSYSVSGNVATLTVALTFSGSFGEPKNVYLRAWEADSRNSGWVQAGAWVP